MDDHLFDRWTRALGSRLDRRRATRLAAVVFGALSAGVSFADDAGAKKKKKKKKKKRKKNGFGASPPPPTSPPGSPPASPPASPPPPPPGSVLATYDITLQGDVDGLAFQRAGVLRLLQPFPDSGTQNGSNVIDVCLTSGSPAISPSTGAIQFGSNSGCNGGVAQLDLAKVSQPTAQQILVEPDPNLAATCNNIYNRTSGVTAFVYSPYNGGMLLELRSEGQAIVGTIDTNGLGSCRTPVGSRYQAVLSGQRR